MFVALYIYLTLCIGICGIVCVFVLLRVSVFVSAFLQGVFVCPSVSDRQPALASGRGLGLDSTEIAGCARAGVRPFLSTKLSDGRGG